MTHFGEGRLQGPAWPIPQDSESFVTMSRYVLNRVEIASKGAADPRMGVASRVASLGLEYLDDPTTARLAPIAALVG